jgi:hypothetical protein
VELWTQPAEQMLASLDVGGVPLVPLMDIQGPLETILRRGRERIDREEGAQHANLLAVTQTFIKLRFPQQTLLDIFGGSRAMIESPLIKEIVAKAEHQTLRTAMEDLIRGRFAALPDNARASLEGMHDQARRRSLHLFAGLCPTLEAFLDRLAKEATRSPHTVTPRRSRKR